ncbi:MAG TPA: Na/Pi cotransporter family protein [Firmicutes bacterium]|nr:Na/Pi cotransporter family protein [Bacillota bacterium]
MEYVYGVMGLLGGLGVLLFGFKVLSDAIEKLANDRLRSWFSKTSGTGRLAGVGIGLVTTTIIQSSSATTVMTVGFVNAGVMSLTMATAVIMGANIGTTITAQIAALSAFEFSSFVLPFAFIGIFMAMLSKKDKVQTVGYILGGLGLVFVGLDIMGSSMDIFATSDTFKDLLLTIDNPFLLLLIGTAFTALIQSSSAVTTIIITMVGAGLMIGSGGNSVYFLVLGSNIGTCVTALLSAIGANTNAKRAALIHLMFNVFGTILFTIMMLCWPTFSQITFEAWFPGNPQTQIAMFHTFFNTVCVILFFPFINVFVKIATFLIRDKKEKEEQAETFLDDRFLTTPSIALLQAKKEVTRLATLAIDTLRESVNAFINKDKSDDTVIKEKIVNVNTISRRVTKFLIKLSASEVSYRDEKTISALHESLGDILRIADLADNMTKYTAHYVDDHLEFTDTVIGEVKAMDEKLGQLFDESMAAFNDENITAVVKAEELENEIDSLKKHTIDGHIRRLNEGKCQPQASSVFINLVGNIERAADHVLNLAHAFDKK